MTLRPKVLSFSQVQHVILTFFPDLDLEEHSEHFGGGKDSESSSGEDGGVTAREHYVDVGYVLRDPGVIHF